jgi:hypothetical protein
MSKLRHLLLITVLAVLSFTLLLCSLKLPLWQMRLEAPQYRDQEALQIAVYPNKFNGDMRELSVLDQYIGVHIPPTLPQFKWLPAVLVAAGVLAVLVSLLWGKIRARALFGVAASLTAAVLFAAIQANLQIHDIGHKRDQKTILVGVRDFTPPFIGTAKIAQFTVTSRFGLGAWLIGSALALQLGAAWMSRSKFPAGVGASRLKHPLKENMSRLASVAN